MELIGIVLLIAFLCWFIPYIRGQFTYEKAQLRITVDGEEYGIYSLEEDQVIHIGDTNVCGEQLPQIFKSGNTVKFYDFNMRYPMPLICLLPMTRITPIPFHIFTGLLAFSTTKQPSYLPSAIQHNRPSGCMLHIPAPAVLLRYPC